MLLLGALTMSLGATAAHAGDTTQIDLVLDASGSMKGKIKGRTKMEIAREALSRFVDELAKKQDVQVALRVYGHLNGKCTNSVLEVPMGPVDAAALKQRIAKIKPKGKTPISYSLEQAVDDFNSGLTGDKVIYLITDGLESCKADPCATARKLKQAGVVSQTHVVGFGLDKKGIAALQCIAKPFGGTVHGAKDAAQLAGAFGQMVQRTFADNLILKAQDDAGKALLADYAVYTAGRTSGPVAGGDTSLGHQGKASLAPGTYDVKVTYRATGAELWLRGIIIPETGQVSKTALFAERKLAVHFVDGTGANRQGNVYVYDPTGVELKFADTSMGGTAHFTLLPGTYDVKLEDYETKKLFWLRGLDLTTTRELKKDVVFK